MSQSNQLRPSGDETLDSSLLDIESISECHSFYSQTSDLTADEILEPITSKLQAIALVEPSSPSVLSTQSSKRLEWDSGADVGYQNLVSRHGELQLCSIEKMALSSSATRLCFDDDDRSESLLLKIDHLLQRHNRKLAFTESNRNMESGKIKNKESLASSRTSVDTVVMVPKIVVSEDQPFSREAEPDVWVAESRTIESGKIAGTEQTAKEHDLTLRSEFPSNFHAHPIDHLPHEVQSEEAGDVKLRETETEGETTGYPDDSESIVSVKTKNSPGKASISSKTAKLKVYRTFREHLQSLRQYVTQLEKTWDFLAESESERERAASSLSSVRAGTGENTRRNRKARHPSRTSGSLDSSSKSSKIPVEKLDLQDLISSPEPSSSGTITTTTKRTCCSHCPTKAKTKKKNDDLGYRPAEMIPQREAVAFTVEIGANSSKPATSQSLQEAFRNRKNDFIDRCEQRQQLLRRAAEWRLQNGKPNQKPPHLFTYNQLRQQTEALYRKLPEAQDTKRSKRMEQQRGISSKYNRSAAFIFQKRLQQRVLKGQVAFPHTTCLLSGC